MIQIKTDFEEDFSHRFFGRGACARTLPVWHLVGGLDPLDGSDDSGHDPDDGYPVTLTDWIDRDGAKLSEDQTAGQ